jgi:hypothetical protein
LVSYQTCYYHLKLACLNAGVNRSWMDGATDLDGHHRIDEFSRQVDMGCYEYLFRGTMYRIPGF